MSGDAMRALRGCGAAGILAAGLVGCGSARDASTVESPAVNTLEVDAATSTSRPERAPRPTVPPGAVLSLPRVDWPCDIDETLADGGGRQILQFVYGDRTECVLPANLAAQGLVGCADEIVAYNFGDDSPRYRLRFTYDASGTLHSTQDGDAVPDTFAWGPTLVQKASDGDRLYGPIEGGFSVTEGGKQAVVARVEGGRVVEITLNFFILDRTLVQKIEWTRGRVTRIDSGGDILVPSYDCGSGWRSKWEDPPPP